MHPVGKRIAMQRIRTRSRAQPMAAAVQSMINLVAIP
jgi:hypothetical protein